MGDATNGSENGSSVMGEEGILFVGTGVSSGVPVLEHLMSDKFRCDTCESACCDAHSRNRRNNVSVLIRTKHNKSILIDVGKTFRESVIRVFRPNKVKHIDAILITHDHADAIFGLDDVRELQEWDRPVGDDGHKKFQPTLRVPTFCSPSTMRAIEQQFPYIAKATATEKPLDRKVTKLDFRVVSEDPEAPLETFCAGATSRQEGGLDVTCLPVWHGANYTCLGFGFGEVDRVVYLSDVSGVPDKVMQKIEQMKPIKMLVVDALHWERRHFSHNNALESLELVKQLEPEHTYFVGMHCDMEHEETNAKLKQWVDKHRAEKIDTHVRTVQCAYDGQFVGLHLTEDRVAA